LCLLVSASSGCCAYWCKHPVSVVPTGVSIQCVLCLLVSASSGCCAYWCKHPVCVVPTGVSIQCVLCLLVSASSGCCTYWCKHPVCVVPTGVSIQCVLCLLWSQLRKLKTVSPNSIITHDRSFIYAMCTPSPTLHKTHCLNWTGSPVNAV